MKMLWFAVLYGVVTASAAAEMDTINAGIRARTAALRLQPGQAMRVALVNGPVKEDPPSAVAAEPAPAAKPANWLQSPEARCTTYFVTVDACASPTGRCAPPPKTQAQLTEQD